MEDRYPGDFVNDSEIDPAPLRLQQILREQTPRLLGYIKFHFPAALAGVVEPEDILQDTYFDAFQRLSEFKPAGDDADFRWLVTIARNRMIDLIRMSRSIKRGGLASLENAEVSDVIVLLEQLAVYSRTPSQSAISHETARSIENSLAELEPQYREVLTLRYLEGMSLKEVATRMSRSVGAIAMLCRRGLDQIRLELQPVLQLPKP